MLLENVRYIFWIGLAVLIGTLAYTYSSRPIDYFSVYIGFILSFLGIYINNYFTRPNIKICMGSEDDAPDGSLRFVHVNIINLDNPKWFFVFRRKTAENCKVRLTFKNTDSTTTFFSMFGRWSAKGEPITPEGKPDISKFPEGMTTSISPSETLQDLREGKLGLAVKFNNENECYGFNDWSYAYAFKHPQFKLNKGKFKVVIEVMTGARVFSRGVIMDNSSKDIEKFRLSPNSDPC